MYAQVFRQGQSWLTGTIGKCLGPVSFKVETNDGQVIRHHQDHLRKRSTQALISSDGSVADDTTSNNSGTCQPR